MDRENLIIKALGMHPDDELFVRQRNDEKAFDEDNDCYWYFDGEDDLRPVGATTPPGVNRYPRDGPWGDEQDAANHRRRVRPRGAVAGAVGRRTS